MEEDLELVQQVRAGARQAYAGLVRRHQARVRGYCLGVLGNAADADDAAQEIFLKAYRGLAGFRGGARFSTWLCRIAINHCRDLLRKRAGRREESWDALIEAEGEGLEARTAVPPAGRLSEERRRQLYRLLAALPAGAREVLILREGQGLRYEEIAAVLGCSLDGVKARLKRARQAARERKEARDD
ncbi:MAG: RNA polymerase subunit sigma-24 [Candidatus Omnitrophica bacterium CG11_big_fil_rev_8_21_14_0_20_64_10]|nr:MAG: RNA polymerase subunit sigma-24 [Candidatus Omnitrophica bacterium CG11_big_fil_rev_8_21_14_0_20_64_10]